MATLEKTKKKSKHSIASSSKIKNKENNVKLEVNEDKNCETSNISHTSLDVNLVNDAQETTSKSTDILEESCSEGLLETKIESISNSADVLNESCTEEIKDLQETNTEFTTILKESSKDKIFVNYVTKMKEDSKVITYPQLPCTESSQVKEILKQEEYIKPFTESQLIALYNNQEILASQQFIQQFIETELRGVNSKKHPLYELITSYLIARGKLKEINLELNQLKNDCNECQNQLWCILDARINGKAQCSDNATVTATHIYTTATFQRNLLESLILVQNKIKRLTNYVHALYSYNCCLYKLKIEYYLDTVFRKCHKYLNLSDKEVTLIDQNLQKSNQAQDHALSELRLCISVLFYFQRQLYKDKEILIETRHWLTNMISLLLRVANWQDHMYLLNHVLRCPAGIHNWAINYIQIPSPPFTDRNDTPFADRYVNHMIAVLSVILVPIEKRDAFLEQIISSLNEATDVVSENLWVLVDSDGESDDDNSCGIMSLKENDLVSLLNQIPLDNLFRTILLIERKDNQDVFNVLLFTEHYVLRLFAFSTVLIHLINKGLITYTTMRYNQFAKRLCRLMRHILQYVSDAWEVFKSTNSSLNHDTAMLNRLQVEFDAFFLRTTSCLFRAQKLGSWQFLAIAPFHMISLNTLWLFFYMLHQDIQTDNDLEFMIKSMTSYIDFKSKLSEVTLRHQFCDRLCIMPAEQSYYLLNTFGNMILARSQDDTEFIQFATLNLLQIGFSDTENLESCRKCAAILLANITQRYPGLISDILSFIRNSINNLESLIFLFSELPLYLWKPLEKDIDILTIWLLQNPINSVESFLARKILLNLNWNFTTDGQLFLPLLLHREIAILILQAVEKYSPQMDSYYTFLEGFKNHQNSVENNFIKFAWRLMYQLKLHSIDRNTCNVENIPEIIRFDVIQRGVREKKSLACYCAIAMTSIGHLLPLVCSDGLTYLEQLISLYKYDAALIALYYIVPLFLDNTDTLIMCTSFQNIINNLLNADKTYYKLAKSLITVEFPGTILKHFSDLIQMHIHNPKWHDLFIFWVKTFVSIPSWNNNKGILYLMNNIISVAFFVPEKYQAIEVLFNELLVAKSNDRNNSSNSSLLSWVPLVGNSQSTGSSILLQGNTSEEPWLTYLTISLEHHHVELRTGLWQELLKQLYETKGKTNIDNSLKKAANILKVPSYSSNGLCIYRWCQLALDTSFDHPLLPLIWQKFFSLYLIRVPCLGNHGSVGNKFFDGVFNTSFLKKIKKRLQESVEFFKNKLDATVEAPSQNNKDLFQKCLNIFKAYVLWLEEPIIMEATLYFPSLPPQYEPRYLIHMVQNTTSPWMEFINYEMIQFSYQQTHEEWIQFCNRSNKFRPPLQQIGGGDLKNPADRILRRLNSYDKPVATPNFNRSAIIIPTITIPNSDSKTISSTLQPHIKKLQQFADIYALQVSEHIALDSQYKELIPQLYSNFTTKLTMKKVCKATCAGVANIRMTFTEARINESIKHQIVTNRKNLSTLLTRSLQPAAVNMCLCCASFEQTVDLLNSQLYDSLRIGDVQLENELRQIGVELFYYLLSCFNEELKTYPPSQQMFHNCLEKLGNVFIMGVENEVIRLFRKIIQKPSQCSLLTPHFIANELNTNIFLQLYQEICDQLELMPEITFSLISKFDINNWLSKKSPRLADRSKFIQLVFQSLCKLGVKSPTEKSNIATLHELYRRHLLTIFQFDFPNHYGEILMHILQYSGQQTLMIEIWLDIINVLAHPVAIQCGAHLNDCLRRHATNQKMLRNGELDETIKLLAQYFCHERLQFGLYGLYPKYRNYVEQISIFMGQTYYAYTVSTLNLYSGELAETLVAQYFWPKLIEMFAPWLIPYSVKECRDTTAAWIQQLTDDRAVLLPWIQADINHAQYMFNMFINCVLFINDTLPASNTLLCYLWQFYATHFAHISIKEHILVVVHSNISQIPWKKFWPSLTDLEIMLKVIDQYIPECHIFLGKLFLEINWQIWLTHLVHQTNQITSRAHHCLLHLFVKLSNEPSVRQNDKARELLEKARDFNTWYLLDVKSLESALDWYIMSCDPRVVLMNSELIKQIDNATFQLLRIVSCYDVNISQTNIEMQESSQIIKKRQCFMRAFIKMLVNCSSRYKNLLSATPQQFIVTLKAQLDYLETILNKVPDETKVNDSDCLIKEFLMVVNNPCLSQLSINCINEWLENRTANSILLCSVLRNANVINNDDALSCILEQALCSYFNDIFDTRVDWTSAIQLLNTGPPKQIQKQSPLEITLINNGRLLTLYAILFKKIILLTEDNKEGTELLLETLVNWLSIVKGTDFVEDKLPLFWVQVIRLSLKLCHFGIEEKCSIYLRKFVHQHLLIIAENKSAPTESNALSWGRGLLGAIGLIKQNAVSTKCRFLCKSLAAYILAQLPDPKGKASSVRCFSGATGPVGQPSGNTECARILLKLDSGGSATELKPYVESSLKQIQDPQNSLHNAEDFLFNLVTVLYTNKQYLQRF